MSVCAQLLSHVQSFVTPWTVARHTHLSMEFSKKEHWSRLPFPTPGIFSIQGSNSRLLHLQHWQVDSLPVAIPIYISTNSYKLYIDTLKYWLYSSCCSIYPCSLMHISLQLLILYPILHLSFLSPLW